MSFTPKKGQPLGQSRVAAARNGPRVPLFALVVGGLVVVVVLALVAISLGGDDSDSLAEGDQAFAPVEVEGDALPPYDAEAAVDPAVGMPAPTLVGETPSGEPITIDPSEGPMVVAFLAHWCPHCQAEVPRIVDLSDDGTIDGVPVTAVLTASDPAKGNFPPGAWLEDEDWPGPVMVDTEPEPSSAAYDAYGVAGFPFLVAIDADGNVAARSSGELGDEGLQEFFAQVAA